MVGGGVNQSAEVSESGEAKLANSPCSTEPGGEGLLAGGTAMLGVVVEGRYCRSLLRYSNG